MKENIAKEHIQVLQTMYNCGKISRQAMKSIRGQIISMKTFSERETYLKKIIKSEGAKIG